MNFYLAHGEIIPGARTETKKSSVGEAGEKVSLESPQFHAESWEHTVFVSTLWWLLEDGHKPECTSSVVKQKVISGDMCRGGDIRDMPVVQKEQGEQERSGERAICS